MTSSLDIRVALANTAEAFYSPVMTLTLGAVTIDTTDALGLARWWAERTGGTITAENDGWHVVVELPGGRPGLAFQRVEDPTPGKNRLHLDIVTDGDLDATVDEFVAAGASLVADRTMPGFRWVTLADPAGNQFCVAPPHD